MAVGKGNPEERKRGRELRSCSHRGGSMVLPREERSKGRKVDSITAAWSEVE